MAVFQALRPSLRLASPQSKPSIQSLSPAAARSPFAEEWSEESFLQDALATVSPPCTEVFATGCPVPAAARHDPDPDPAESAMIRAQP